ncbi:hypothetical protein [Salipiger mucosus]|uniref:Riorf47 protein n=1 Tax=Salipiger mucosus DSM 16094 TaxID=1123237 RepID=S9SBF9_9RHOB|nr:hypothetical protein [Salipiger mucosus]EPX83554.1 Riorf47 protein [Salipiger mucosus DSM 16094]
MIELKPLSDDDPALEFSPLLRAAQRTLEYACDYGSIGLTTRKNFKRDFVHWSVEAFEWPGFGPQQAFQFRKVLNEYEFVPLQVIHFLLLHTRLGRHYKGEFRLTAKGRGLAESPGDLFSCIVPFFLFEVDHASYGRFGRRPVGTWDIWLNVLNVEVEDGATERDLFQQFYGDGPNWDNDGWREIVAFSQCVTRPLAWAGLVTLQEIDGGGVSSRMCFKTPLWRSALILDTDDQVRPAVRH